MNVPPLVCSASSFVSSRAPMRLSTRSGLLLLGILDSSLFHIWFPSPNMPWQNLALLKLFSPLCKLRLAPRAGDTTRLTRPD
jgi:hypothetical protein